MHKPNENCEEFLKKQINDFLVIAKMRGISLLELNDLFGKLGVERARSYVNLNIKAQSIDNTTLLNNVHDMLEALVDEHITYDDKLLTIYKDVKNFQEIKSFLDNIFLNLTKINFDNLEVSETIFLPYKKIEIGANANIYQFVQKREIEIRKNIDLSDLKENSDNFTKIYGYKSVELLCFDAILIDMINKKIILMNDLVSNVAPQLRLTFKGYFIKYLNENCLKPLISNTLTDAHSINLFPSIDVLYNSKLNSDLGVVELNFLTNEGSSHREKIRDGMKDLRTGNYHKGGVSGLKNSIYNGQVLNENIIPYRVSYRNYAIGVTVHLNGNHRDLNKSISPKLFEFLLTGSRNYSSLTYGLKIVGAI